MPGPVAAPPTPVPLSTLRQGQSGIITDTHLDPDDAALLRAMGLCTSATIKIIRPGQPCVVAVGGVSGSEGENAESCACGGTCRIGLARAVFPPAAREQRQPRREE